jgi:glycosyltransferase involved in cell wall biosynthesis
VPFFEALRAQMACRNIELLLAHGVPTAAEESKQDEGELPWAHRINTAYLLGGAVCWQPFEALAKASDLVVLTHENKLICNLAAQYLSRRNRVALWGHGANLQGDPSSWKERFKRRTARQADWWFGYTEMSRPLIQRTGFPAERTTILNNAIDTIALSRQFASVTAESSNSLRKELGIQGQCVGVFLGSLYSEKRIPFLLDAARAVRERVPEFELLIAGAGPDLNMVEAFCADNDWVRYVGPKTGQGKADLLALAHVMLNPGLVGLGILDSFVCKVPMVTTDCGLHSPEVAYLEDAVNGVMASDDLSSYVDAVVDLLENHQCRASLVAGCALSASMYTIENMARNFCDGVVQCLEAPAYRSWM